MLYFLGWLASRAATKACVQIDSWLGKWFQGAGARGQEHKPGKVGRTGRGCHAGHYCRWVALWPRGTFCGALLYLSEPCARRWKGTAYLWSPDPRWSLGAPWVYTSERYAGTGATRAPGQESRDRRWRAPEWASVRHWKLGSTPWLPRTANWTRGTWGGAQDVVNTIVSLRNSATW